MLLLGADGIKEGLQLGVMLRRDVCDHQGEQFQIVGVLFKFPLP